MDVDQGHGHCSEDGLGVEGRLGVALGRLVGLVGGFWPLDIPDALDGRHRLDCGSDYDFGSSTRLDARFDVDVSVDLIGGGMDGSDSATGTAPSTTWWVVGGLSLGCAVATKYPAILLAPALVLHARAMRQLRNSFPFWLAFLAVILAVEAWLWALYGRPHLWEVLTRSGEIPRGPLGGRAMGTVVRLSMGMSAIFLLPHATKKGIVVLGG